MAPGVLYWDIALFSLQSSFTLYHCLIVTKIQIGRADSAQAVTAVSVLHLDSYFLDFQDLQTEVHRSIIETMTFHLVLYKIIGLKSHVFDCIRIISH